MNPISEKLAAAAALFTLLVVAAPAARADDYCITSGAQAAHGCGYPTMEMCRAASAGICTLSSSSKSASDAMAYQPAQPQSRGKRKPATRH